MFRALLPVLLTVFLDLVGFGIVIPLLTFYAEHHGASALQVTLLMACYSLAQFLFAPVWGRLSDRVGRRPVMLVSIAATALGLAGFASATELWMLFAFRTLHGMATANIATAQAAVADITPPEKRAMGMGLIGAAFGVGFTLGPWIGGELAAYGYTTPIWFAAGLSALNFALAAALLPETRRPGSAARPRPLHPGAFLRVAAHPVVGLCVVLTFVLTLAFGAMESTFTLFAEHLRGLSAPEVGRMFGVAGLTMVLVQGGLIHRLVKRFGEAPLVPLGVALLAVGLAALPFAPAPGPLLGTFIVIAVGQGLASPSLNSLISRSTSPDEQGFVLGTNQSLSALARVLGPVSGGLLYQGVAPEAPFVAGAGVLAAGVGLAWVAVRRAARTSGSSAAHAP